MATVEPLKDPREINLIKIYLKQRNPRDYLMFLIGCNVGLRIGDLLQLKLSDFVFGEQRIIKKHLTITEAKTGKVRKIALNSTVQKGIKQFLSEHHPQLEDFLFPSRKGKNSPISPTQAYRVLCQAATACKIDVNFGSHSMRKTWAFWVYTKTGNNLGLIMDMLGHANAKITLRYIGLNQLQKDAAYMLVEI